MGALAYLLQLRANLSCVLGPKIRQLQLISTHALLGNIATIQINPLQLQKWEILIASQILHLLHLPSFKILSREIFAILQEATHAILENAKIQYVKQKMTSGLHARLIKTVQLVPIAILKSALK